jgi:hypothetical protein
MTWVEFEAEYWPARAGEVGLRQEFAYIEERLDRIAPTLLTPRKLMVSLEFYH